MRTSFDKQLEFLNQKLIETGSLCENIISISGNALINIDKTAENKISDLELQIKQKEREIEALCIKLLLQYQPVARDLRQISSSLKIITDMGRIGQQAMNISELISYMNNMSDKNKEYFKKISKESIKMVNKCIDSFVEKNINLAKEVMEYDDVVDNLFIEIRNSLISDITHQEKDYENTIDLLMIAKYFEKISDHAVNISEWVIFCVEGTHKGDYKL